MTDILKGITVLDLTQNIAGPFCTQLLGDFGADVIKVERPLTGDDARKWAPPASQGIGTAFLSVNRNKRSVGIDITTPQGLAVVRRLADKADVLVHAVRPGSLEARGLGCEALQATNPRLMYCAVSAFGETGPLARDPGYDPLIQAFTGIMSVTGHPDRPPARAGISVIDVGTGMWAFIGILSALYQRKETGRGARVHRPGHQHVAPVDRRRRPRRPRKRAAFSAGRGRRMRAGGVTCGAPGTPCPASMMCCRWPISSSASPPNTPRRSMGVPCCWAAAPRCRRRGAAVGAGTAATPDRRGGACRVAGAAVRALAGAGRNAELKADRRVRACRGWRTSQVSMVEDKDRCGVACGKRHTWRAG